jgi:nucleoside-diphosphate-sugar epimerase
LDWIWFQIHYVYSTEYLKPAVISKALDALTNGKILSLRTPSDVHDFIEVRDAADAIVHSLINGHRGTIEIGTGITIKVSKLLKLLFPNLKISEEDSTENRISYQGAASVERLVKSGWNPKFSIH